VEVQVLSSAPSITPLNLILLKLYFMV